MEYHIAVVDDDVASLNNVRILLTERGMKVSCLRSGKDLLKYMEEHTPDLILMDVIMPDMDGFATLNRLRFVEEKAEKKRTPVIFLTGDGDVEAERRGLRLGASDFIHKPINPDVITRRIVNSITNNQTIASLTEEATIDKLTGLYNKAYGTTRITDAIKDVLKEVTGALLMFDLDNFKLVNDLFGHDMGDRVLAAFADNLKKNTRETDILSRIGGDEFLGLFPSIDDEKAVASLTERLNNELLTDAAELMGEDFGIPLGISVGAVMLTGTKESYESLFDMADSAMYSAKNNGKHGHSIYSMTSDTKEYDRLDLGHEIDRITRIMEERNSEEGALLLGADSFALCYRLIVRQTALHGRKALKMIFSLVPDEGSASDMPEASDRFGTLLQAKLRKSDIIYRNRSSQFFVVLQELSEEDSGKVIDRILSEWDNTGFSKSIHPEYALKAI